MRKTILTAAMAAGLPWPGASWAGVTAQDATIATADHLYNLCIADENEPWRDFALGACAGYLSGAYDAMPTVAFWQAAGRADFRWCFPEKVPAALLREAFIKWYEVYRLADTSNRRRGAYGAVLMSWSAAFPCD